jgi:hypothetical protein
MLCLIALRLVPLIPVRCSIAFIASVNCQASWRLSVSSDWHRLPVIRSIIPRSCRSSQPRSPDRWRIAACCPALARCPSIARMATLSRQQVADLPSIRKPIDSHRANRSSNCSKLRSFELVHGPPLGLRYWASTMRYRLSPNSPRIPAARTATWMSCICPLLSFDFIVFRI